MTEPTPQYATTLSENVLGTHLPNELSEFVSADYPPIDDKPVLAIRESGYIHCKYELITVRYVKDRIDPWRTIDGESVKHSGKPVLGWRNAIRWIQPA